MAESTIKATCIYKDADGNKTGEREIEVTVPYGLDEKLSPEENQKALNEALGIELVNQLAVAQADIRYQAKIRQLGTKKEEDGSVVDSGMPDDEIQGIINVFKIGTVTRSGKSKVERAKELVGKLTDEQRRALLDELMASV